MWLWVEHGSSKVTQQIFGCAMPQDTLAFTGTGIFTAKLQKLCAELCAFCRQDVNALKRLQRDAFEQLLRLTEKLDELQERPEALGGDRNASATALFGSTAARPGRFVVTDRAPIQVSGKLIYSTGLQLQVSSPLACHAVPCRPRHIIKSRPCASEHSHEHIGCCNGVQHTIQRLPRHKACSQHRTQHSACAGGRAGAQQPAADA